MVCRYANHLAMTHPSKLIDTSCAVPHTSHSSESILGRNDFPVGCLRLALAYWSLLFVWSTHENWQWRKYRLWTNCSLAWWQLRTGGSNKISKTHFATYSCNQHANHSSVTHRSKMIGISGVVSHTCHNSKSIFWVGIIFHWVAFTWH